MPDIVAALLLRKKEIIARLDAIRVEHMDLMIELREVGEEVEELEKEKRKKSEADTLVDGLPFDGGHAPRTLDKIVEDAHDSSARFRAVDANRALNKGKS
jgi:hypothetical protein